MKKSGNNGNGKRPPRDRIRKPKAEGNNASDKPSDEQFHKDGIPVNNNGNPPAPPKKKVGYKNPPEEHRWKKGKSGNKSGRPKNADRPLDLPKIIYNIAHEEIIINVSEGPKKIQAIEALARALWAKALKSDLKAYSEIFRILEETRIRLEEEKEREKKSDVEKMHEAIAYALGLHPNQQNGLELKP